MRSIPVQRGRRTALALAIAAIGISTATARADDLISKIRATTEAYQRYVDLLDSSSQATRIAALTEMTKSKDSALVDLAIEKGLSSRDDAMQAIAARAAFRQVRSIVARVEAPQPPTAQSQEIVKLCGDGVQYGIDKFNPETGHFEARGQDHVGVGQINGASLSLTIEYGCSLTGILQPDGTFAGMVSAPYRKGALPAKFAFR